MTPRPILTESDAAACHPLMRQLRPHLTLTDFIAAWRRQSAAGYHLIALWPDTTPVALAGYRIQENLVHGRHLYVDDLITDETHRGAGHGHLLMTHLKAIARENTCAKLILDTPRTNLRAHRFYEREGLTSTSQRFATTL